MVAAPVCPRSAEDRGAQGVCCDLNAFEAVAREWFEKQSPAWAAGRGDNFIRRLENNACPRGQPAEVDL